MTQYTPHHLREPANAPVAFALSVVELPGGPTALGLRG
jgi:hypothetical protein